MTVAQMYSEREVEGYGFVGSPSEREAGESADVSMESRVHGGRVGSMRQIEKKVQIARSAESVMEV